MADHDTCSSRNSVNDVCDFIIGNLSAAEQDNNPLKLQKLLYYVQAWHLAFFGFPIFKEEFEAWVHGPVCRPIYDRFVETKSLYSSITAADILGDGVGGLSGEDQYHIKSVLEVYAKYSGTQLEELTHREMPWIKARSGCGPFDHCNEVILEADMQQCYAERLK